MTIIVAIWGLIFIGAGCSKEINYKPGLLTGAIRGKIIYESNDEDGYPFLIIQEYHQTLIEMSGGYLSRVSAAVVQPDEKGNYSVEFETGVNRLDLVFVFRGHYTQTANFKRTLGVGEYEFNVTFNKDDDWVNNYYVLVKPTLINYIVEKRYRIREIEKQYLVDWIDETERLLSSKRDTNENR